MNRLRTWVTGIAVLCLVPTQVLGQAGRTCDLAQSEYAETPARADGTRVAYVVEPVFRCDDGAEIRADSAVLFEA
ncbi:MAG: hypothetical protein R3324_20445, partial [Halobacteriales archaeon]|nr:hypothetical protein [Halobacteriales archaeon]